LLSRRQQGRAGGERELDAADTPNASLRLPPSRRGPHRKLIAYEARTGNIDGGFTAQANTRRGPFVGLIGAHHLYVGGDFTQVGPTRELRPQGGFAQFGRIEAPRP
jgi:hypothetical protein